MYGCLAWYGSGGLSDGYGSRGGRTRTAREAPTSRRPGIPAVKPLLRGRLHLISFEASLVLGTLALANAHGAVPQTAAICPLTCRDAASGPTLATNSPDQVADLARGRDGLSTAQLS
jgi:hypothetical protein